MKITTVLIIIAAAMIPFVLAGIGGYNLIYHFQDGPLILNSTNVCVSSGECLVSLTGLTGNYTTGDCWISFKNGEAYATNCTSF